MRISTAFRYDESVDNLQRRQRDMSEAQDAMTNGKRINKPSDDPTGAARAERAFIAQQRIDSEQRLIEASRNSLQLAESTLGHAVQLLQTARDTVVVAGNGSFTAAERQSQADQLKHLRSQLMSLANQDDGAGGYVFGGQSGHTQPFIDTPSGVVANATPGQQQLSRRETLPTTLDGGAVWLQAATGNGVFTTEAAAGNTGNAWVTPGTVSDPSALTSGHYELTFAVSPLGTTFSITKDGAPTSVSGQPYRPTGAIEIDGMSFNISGEPADGDVFTVDPSTNTLDPFAAIDRAIRVLSNPTARPGEVTQAVNTGIRDLDSVLRQFMGARSAAGANMNRLEQADSRNQDRLLWAQTLQSETEDIDMVAAVSDFQAKQTSYSAALQSYALVQRMSLLDYMK
jgi:flagellar hook-associated protein 3 FlgL